MIKAKDRIKVSLTVDEVLERIPKDEPTIFKTFVDDYQYVSDEVKLELINAGYKVYKGDWDGIMIDVLIIEW